MSNSPFDGVTYLRCEICSAFVVEGEADAHENGCGERAEPTTDRAGRMHKVDLMDEPEDADAQPDQ